MEIYNNTHDNESTSLKRYKHKPKTTLAGKIFITVMSAVIICGVATFVMSITGTGLFKDSSGDSILPEETEQTTELSSDDSSATTDLNTNTVSPSEITFSYIDKNLDAVNTGLLVLIDKNHNYKFPDTELASLYSNKTNSYQLSSSSLQLLPEAITALNAMMDKYVEETGFTNVTVGYAYRDFDTQKALYAQNPTGAAKPGYSDYHCPTTVYLQATVDGKVYNLSNLTESNSEWIRENAAKYGFIFRYPSDKKSITGYSIPWQMRYVGVAHAVYMSKNNLCLEEYLALLSENHCYGNEALTVDCSEENGKIYDIYYVENSVESSSTKVSVPDNREYTISGDNDGGFIVCVDKSTDKTT